jgi:hypothetical protein
MSGRLAHLLEKYIWVVWALQHLFKGPHAGDLDQHGLTVSAGYDDDDKVFIHYTPLAAGTGYVTSTVMLVFGARTRSPLCADPFLLLSI